MQGFAVPLEALQMSCPLQCKACRGDMPPPEPAEPCSRSQELHHKPSEFAVNIENCRCHRRDMVIIPAALLARHICPASNYLARYLAMVPLASVLCLHHHAHLLPQALCSCCFLLCYSSASSLLPFHPCLPTCHCLPTCQGLDPPATHASWLCYPSASSLLPACPVYASALLFPKGVLESQLHDESRG